MKHNIHKEYFKEFFGKIIMNTNNMFSLNYTLFFENQERKIDYSKLTFAGQRTNIFTTFFLRITM